MASFQFLSMRKAQEICVNCLCLLRCCSVRLSASAMVSHLFAPMRMPHILAACILLISLLLVPDEDRATVAPDVAVLMTAIALGSALLNATGPVDGVAKEDERLVFALLLGCCSVRLIADAAAPRLFSSVRNLKTGWCLSWHRTRLLRCFFGALECQCGECTYACFDEKPQDRLVLVLTQDAPSRNFV